MRSSLDHDLNCCACAYCTLCRRQGDLWLSSTLVAVTAHERNARLEAALHDANIKERRLKDELEPLRDDLCRLQEVRVRVCRASNGKDFWIVCWLRGVHLPIHFLLSALRCLRCSRWTETWWSSGEMRAFSKRLTSLGLATTVRRRPAVMVWICSSGSKMSSARTRVLFYLFYRCACTWQRAASLSLCFCHAPDVPIVRERTHTRQLEMIYLAYTRPVASGRKRLSWCSRPHRHCVCFPVLSPAHVTIWLTHFRAMSGAGASSRVGSLRGGIRAIHVSRARDAWCTRGQARQEWDPQECKCK